MTILLILISLFNSWFIGTRILDYLSCEAIDKAKLVKYSLAIGSGLATTSIFLFFWLVINNGNATYYPWFEAALTVTGVSTILWKSYKRKKPHLETSKAITPNNGQDGTTRFIKTLFWGILILTVSRISHISANFPLGKWDAWSIWNLRAAFIFRANGLWETAFSDKIAFSHPDYPLLLPLSVMKGWLYAGSETTLSPIVTGIVFSAALLMLLFGATYYLRSPFSAIVATAMLAGTPLFIAMSASQYADIPIAFFVLATIVMIAWYARAPDNRILAIAGLNAGFAAWTKNEGLLLVVAATIFVTIMVWRENNKPRKATALLHYFAGLVLPLIPVVVFKATLAPANDLVSAFSATQFLLFERFVKVSSYMLKTIIDFGGWQIIFSEAFQPIALMLAYLCWAGTQLRPNENWILPGISGAMLAGYFLAYLASPHPLDWHLSNSCSRLCLQLWPGVIFSFFMIAGQKRNVFVTDPPARIFNQ